MVSRVVDWRLRHTNLHFSNALILKDEVQSNVLQFLQLLLDSHDLDSWTFFNQVVCINHMFRVFYRDGSSDKIRHLLMCLLASQPKDISATEKHKNGVGESKGSTNTHEHVFLCGRMISRHFTLFKFHSIDSSKDTHLNKEEQHGPQFDLKHDRINSLGIFKLVSGNFGPDSENVWLITNLELPILKTRFLNRVLKVTLDHTFKFKIELLSNKCRKHCFFIEGIRTHSPS